MPPGGKGWGGEGGPWGVDPGSPPPGNNNQNLDEILKKSQERLKNAFPEGFGSPKGFAIIGIAILVLWLATGVYRVEPEEQGVVLRFGEFHRTTQPGLRYHLPVPIESVLKPKVTRVNKVEVGFRNIGSSFGGTSASSRAVAEESLMLTGDENIVDINFEVQWKIADAKDFLFNMRSPEETVKQAAESAMREIIGKTTIATIMAEGRLDVEVQTRALLQGVLDSYGAGIEIVRVQLLKADPPGDVIDAFRDVQTARADRERLRNEAEAYRNDILPRARGQAERMVQEASAYREQIVAKSQGEAARFISVYTEYKKAPDVTKERIYLETMEEVLQGMDKLIVDGKGANSVMPYLPLPELKKKQEEKAAQ